MHAEVNLQCVGPLERRLSPPVHPGTELPDHLTAWLWCLKDTLECSACDTAHLSYSPIALEVPTSPSSSPALIVPGCFNDKHSDWWVMILWCKIQSLLLNLYLCGHSFPG